MSDCKTWIQREIAACQALINRQEQRFAARDFAAQSCRELYRDLDHTRRWLRWYTKQNAHLITG